MNTTSKTITHLGAAIFASVLIMLSLGCSTVPQAVESIAKAEEPEPAGHDVSRLIQVSAVGDIMMGGSAAPEMKKYGYDYPFQLTKHLFSDSDVVLGNLEGPLTHEGKNDIEKQYVFRSPPELVAPALKKAGFNVVTLANNHTLDYGYEGLIQTATILSMHGIRHVGAGANSSMARKGVIMDTPGGKVGILGYSLTFPEEFWATSKKAGTAFGHESHIRADVARLKQSADIVIVAMHWGRESTTELRDYQKALGRAAIDAGAAAVIGHHPHVLQAIERYGDGVILYSLGNYVFGSYSRKATRSAIAQLTFENSRLTALQLVPINVNNVEVVFQPRPLKGAEAQEVIKHLQELSIPLDTKIVRNGDMAVVNLEATGKNLALERAASN